MKKQFLGMIFLLLMAAGSMANGITVSNVTVLPNTNQVQFDVSWFNSWRSNTLQNWDAAWVFIKFRDLDGRWLPVLFTNTDNDIPSGYAATIVSDNGGAFLYRAAAGSGTSTLTGVKMGIASQYALGVYDIKVFAIEMVYIPTAPFWAGDYRTSANSFATPFGGSDPVKITGSGGFLVSDPLGGSPEVVPASFPNGYNNFYCMKYEISQGAYRDFLNSMNYLQQSARTASTPNSTPGIPALDNSNTGRSYLKIATSGIDNTLPAVYGCDANNNNVFDEAGDGESVACGYLNWIDVAAYLAWAALAPMTELQYEKVCRGPLQVVNGEYAWGTTQVSTNVYTLISASNNNETVSNLSSTPNEGNAMYLQTSTGINGPVRNGIFATATSNRVSSGGSFYGVMEMSGNLFERVVTTANSQGLTFTGLPGLGSLSSTGYAVQNTWPGGQVIDGTRAALGLIYRGGGQGFQSTYMRTSERSGLTVVSTPDQSRVSYIGGRGIRNL